MWGHRFIICTWQPPSLRFLFKCWVKTTIHYFFAWNVFVVEWNVGSSQSWSSDEVLGKCCVCKGGWPPGGPSKLSSCGWTAGSTDSLHLSKLSSLQTKIKLQFRPTKKKKKCNNIMYYIQKALFSPSLDMGVGLWVCALHLLAFCDQKAQSNQEKKRPDKLCVCYKWFNLALQIFVPILFCFLSSNRPK